MKSESKVTCRIGASIFLATLMWCVLYIQHKEVMLMKPKEPTAQQAEAPSIQPAAETDLHEKVIAFSETHTRETFMSAHAPVTDLGESKTEGLVVDSQSVVAEHQILPPVETSTIAGTPAVMPAQEQQYVTEDALFDEIILFSTTENEPYAAVKIDERVTTAPIDSIEFRIMLVKAIFDDCGSIPPEKELKKIIHDYHYRALLSPYKFPIDTRCGMFGDAIYIDLGDKTGARVKITADRWLIESSGLGPPFFRRPGGMLPLPRPEKGGSIKRLARFLNLKDRSEDYFKLIVGWLVDTLYPGGPYTMLVLNGPQGSAKSTTLRILRDLIDPAEAAMPSLPKSERDMFIAGSKMYLLSYDNVSVLKDNLSDAFCRMINDGTFRTRKLYTNLDEIIIKLRRPVIFNGISHFARQNDFMDRAIFVELPTINEIQRRTEASLLSEWGKDRPQILGALYDLVAVALRNLNAVQVQRLPRMADSARWITAAESEGLWENGSFLDAYQHNRQGIVNLTLESDPVAVGILNLLDEGSGWTGTNTALLEALRKTTPDGLRKLKEFPKAPNVLSNRLMRLEGFLASKGIGITRERHPDKRLVNLTRINGEEKSGLTSSSLFTPENKQQVAEKDDREEILLELAESEDFAEVPERDNDPVAINEIPANEIVAEAATSMKKFRGMGGAKARI